MSFSDWNALIQTIIQGIALVGGIATVRFAWQQYRTFKKDRVDKIIEEVQSRLREYHSAPPGHNSLLDQSEKERADQISAVIDPILRDILK